MHILVNNAAICLGKKVQEMTVQNVKLTMDINFLSYVALMMLFLRQSDIVCRTSAHRYHIVNVSSIAGHMTSARNSDYSASKFALTGFVDALRQELIHSKSNVSMTNFYPYYINTGLFEGFKPRLGLVMPTLDAHYVVDVMYAAIMSEQTEVYINPIIFWLKQVVQTLPLSLRVLMS